MSAVIETKTASLETFAVTIQALHVNGKQMTLAVFRQLPEGQPDQDSNAWGRVHYQIKDSADWWLVFSNAGILYRYNFYADNLSRHYGANTWNLDRAQKELDAAIIGLKKSAAFCRSDEYIKKLKDEVSEKERIRNAHFDTYQNELAWAEWNKKNIAEWLKLPQLFIAV